MAQREYANRSPVLPESAKIHCIVNKGLPVATERLYILLHRSVDPWTISKIMAFKEGKLKTRLSDLKMQIVEEGFAKPCWKTLLATTSAHGYPHIVDKTYPVIVRLSWVILW